MADEQIAQPALMLELTKKVEYLILHRNIECGDRLIADNECRVEGDGACNAYPLALPAGELVGVAEEELLRDADIAQKREHAFGHFLLCVAEFVRFQRFRHNVTHGHARIKGGVGILKYELHTATVWAEVLLAE